MTGQDYLKEHGINEKSIKNFGIKVEKVTNCRYKEDGCTGDHVTYPVKDAVGKVLFSKIRHVNVLKGNKLTSTGGAAVIYNSSILKNHDVVFLTEGEVDCVRLIQEGISAAVSGTAGSKTFKDDWLPLFKNKTVFVCYDTDEKGQEGAQIVLKKLPNAIPIKLPGDVNDICEYFNKYSLDDFKVWWNEQVALSSGTETPGAVDKIDDLVTLVESYIPNTGIALKLALAVATSGTRENRVMLWFIFVGAPSGGKTDITKLLKKSKTTYSVDSLTQNAFVSGERETDKKKNQDMLPAIGGRCLIIKDLTVIFSQNEEAAKKIIGDLVGIYDKEFAKQSPGRGNISYESEFSILACITPATLNRHHNYLNMIGPRFLQYTIPALTTEEEDKSFDAIFNSKVDRKLQEKEVQLRVSSYLDYLTSQDISQVKEPGKDIQQYLKVASKFIARARGIVIIQASSFKGDDGKNKTFYEPLDIQIEYPWRAVQQLLTLSKYLTLVAQTTEIGNEELEIVKDVVLASMPADRAQAVHALKGSPEITAKDLSGQLHKSWKTASRLLEELSMLGVVVKEPGVGQIAASYQLASEFKDFVTLSVESYMSTPEFMSNNYRWTETSGRTHTDDKLMEPKSLEEALDALPF